jgi:transcriptional regulator with XRE-family HTH domain
VTTVRWHEGDVVRKLRATLGWKLEHLARVSTVSLQVIHKLEIGKTKEPKRSTLKKLAKAFGLTDRQLLDAVPPAIDLPLVIPTTLPARAAPAIMETVVTNAKHALAHLEATQHRHVAKRRAAPHTARKR